jgi:hypothetical protein
MSTSSLFIDYDLLLEVSGKLMDGHVSYGLGSKAPSLDCDPAAITKIDCSGFVRYLLYQATDNQVVLPDGSWHQREWCQGKKLAKVDYEEAGSSDGWLRIAFISPRKGHAGHVWLILEGQTLESHGKTKGPDRRPWNTRVLTAGVSACFRLAQMYTITIGPVQVVPTDAGTSL